MCCQCEADARSAAQKATEAAALAAQKAQQQREAKEQAKSVESERAAASPRLQTLAKQYLENAQARLLRAEQALQERERAEALALAARRAQEAAELVKVKVEQAQVDEAARQEVIARVSQLSADDSFRSLVEAAKRKAIAAASALMSPSASGPSHAATAAVATAGRHKPADVAATQPPLQPPPGVSDAKRAVAQTSGAASAAALDPRAPGTAVKPAMAERDPSLAAVRAVVCALCGDGPFLRKDACDLHFSTTHHVDEMRRLTGVLAQVRGIERTATVLPESTRFNATAFALSFGSVYENVGEIVQMATDPPAVDTDNRSVAPSVATANAPPPQLPTNYSQMSASASLCAFLREYGLRPSPIANGPMLVSGLSSHMDASDKKLVFEAGDHVRLSRFSFGCH